MEKHSLKKRVVVFGIFDGVHKGHRDLFRQARELGSELVAIVGRDNIAEQLKGKKPMYSESERVAMLQQEPLVHTAVLGDARISNYAIVETLKPDSIYVGYDQQDLRQDLMRWMKKRGKYIDIYTAKSYKPHIFHTSLLTKK
jgi:choline-phosphate cytidylyltransferase